MDWVGVEPTSSAMPNIDRKKKFVQTSHRSNLLLALDKEPLRFIKRCQKSEEYAQTVELASLKYALCNCNATFFEVLKQVLD
jgi:hypothetical protein